MEKKITRVRWRAENVPWGMDFDERTGIFSGTPEETGEFIVPVTIETNYGKDTRNVKIIVTSPYKINVISGRRAWVQDYPKGIYPEPDIDGFYPVSKNIPSNFSNVTAISNYPYGFRAYTQSGDIYGCGLTGVVNGSLSSSFDIWNVVTGINEITSSDYIRCVGFKQHRNSSPNYHRLGSCAMLTADGKMTIKHIVFHEVETSSYKTEKIFEDIGGVSIENLPVLDIGTYDGGIRWLSEDGTQDCYIQYNSNNCWYNTTATLITRDLGYRAIKLISPAPFNFLSEDKLLDNNPDNFTHGTIKDVWGYGELMYVQTTENQLYEYISDTNTWNFLGIYDVKKIEVPNEKYMFMLTNDGKLFHKGKIVSSINEIVNKSVNIATPNEILTHIFPTQHITDFTFCHGIGFNNGIDSANDYNYLFVLRE